MTTFRSRVPARLRGLAACCCAASAAPAIAQEADGCSNVDPMAERRCVGERIERKDQELIEVYPKALAAVRRSFARYGKQDARTDPKHLEGAQAAWSRFVKQDCTVRSAFGGGSNMAILDRYLACYEAELDKRLGFLKQLSDGSYGL